MFIPGRKVIITSSILIALSVGGVITYLNNGDSTEKASTNKTASAQKASEDNLLKTMNVNSMKNTSIESQILWNFYYGKQKGKDKTIALSEKPRIDEQQFISASEKFIAAERLQTAISLLGKTKSEVEANDASTLEKIEVVYNSKNVVESVTLEIISSSPQQIKQFAGKPVYELEDKAYLYHGQTHDFVIYSTDENLFNKMTILPVLEKVQEEEVHAEETQEITEESDSEEEDKSQENQTKKGTSSSSQKSSSKNNSTSPNAGAGTSPTQPAPAPKNNTEPTPTPVPPEDTTPTPPPVPPEDNPTPPETPPVEEPPAEKPDVPKDTPPAG